MSRQVKNRLSGNGPSGLPIDEIVQGNVLEVLRTFPAEAVDMVITSPPYWGLRNYGTDPQVWGGDADCNHDFSRRADLGPRHGESRSCTRCNAWLGELGSEPYFFQFVEHLCDIFDEVKRVLKPTGSCWVNLGDTYAKKNMKADRTGKVVDIQTKSLCQLPSRFAIEMTNRGWILRNEIVWFKPNIMPSSIRDPFTVDFEKMFLFTRSQEYFFDQQFEPSTSPDRLKRRSFDPERTPKIRYGEQPLVSSINPKTADASRRRVLVRGRNKRAVWRVATGSFSGAHFAVYPPKLLETPIKAGCPEFVCRACGTPREKIYQGRSRSAFNIRVRDVKEGRIKHSDRRASATETETYDERDYRGYGRRLVGLTDCGCGAGFEPGVVLDPFMGSGTTALVARRLGRSFIGIELNPAYIELARERIKSSEPIG